MVRLRSPDGAEVIIPRGETAAFTKGAIAERGYEGWTKVEDLDDFPSEDLTEEEREAARLNTLTRAEFMAEVMKRVEERIASANIG